MATLVDLVRLGALGASLAFLYLAYKLLESESGMRDSNGNPISPRPEILKEIRNFSWLAMAFFFVGVASQFLFENGRQISTSLFGNDLIRVRFQSWAFEPGQRTISFALEEDRAETDRFAALAERGKYAVYIGVRKNDGTPYRQGKYPVWHGPYSVENLARVTIELADQQLQALGTGCVEFAAFGFLNGERPSEQTVLSSSGDERQLPIAFHTAGVCA